MKTRSQKSALKIKIGAAVTFAFFFLLPWSETIKAQSNTFPSSGNVGIGTTSPSLQLHLRNSSTAQARIESTAAAAAAIDFKNTSRRWVVGTGILAGGGDFSIYDANSSLTRMYFDASGNVGIGTTTPAAKLEISGANVLPRVTNTNATSYGGLELFEGGTIKFGLHTVGSSSGSSFVGGANAAQLWNYANAPMVFGTNSSERMRIDAGGNVGIGTTSPGSRLDVGAGAAARGSYTDLLVGSGGNNAQIELFGPTKSAVIANDEGLNGLVLYTNGPSFNSALFLGNSGYVGIGTTTPSKKLDVVGDINATGTITGGNIIAKYQDLAEWVKSSQKLSAATVVVLDQTKSNQVIASSHSYDTRVAGVVSTQPGITLGEAGASKVLVATTGRVKVRVDATNGPIQVGDLLVTSDIAGMAKKSEPLNLGGVAIHRPGTLIGKALESLVKGQGKILVLLSLQ